MRTKPKPGRRRSSSAPRRQATDVGGSPAHAKLFWTGRSQAVRLPKEFRFEGESVLIRREGNRVILEPDEGWPPGYMDWLLSGPLLDIEPPSREGPARSRDVFQVPVNDGSGRTANVFDLLARKRRKLKRRTK